MRTSSRFRPCRRVLLAVSLSLSLTEISVSCGYRSVWAVPDQTRPAPAAPTIDAEDVADLSRFARRALEIGYTAELKVGLHNIAAQKFDHALAAIPDAPHSSRSGRSEERHYIVRGMALLGAGRTADAAQSFSRALRFRSSSSDAAFLRGLALRRMGDMPQALAAFQDSLWFKNFALFDEPQVLIEQGHAYIAMNAVPQAIVSFQSAVSATPAAIAARLALARALTGSDRPRAQTLLREGIRLSTDSGDRARLRLELAAQLLAGGAGDTRAVLEARDLAQELSADGALDTPLRQSARLLLIRSLIAQGDAAQAEQNLRAALRNSPGDSELLRLQRQIVIEQQAKARDAGAQDQSGT